MNQIFTNPTDAMKAAHQLFTLLGRPVWRYMGVDKRGVTVWVVSLGNASHNAL